jgi:hypothetical protein
MLSATSTVSYPAKEVSGCSDGSQKPASDVPRRIHNIGDYSTHPTSGRRNPSYPAAPVVVPDHTIGTGATKPTSAAMTINADSKPAPDVTFIPFLAYNHPAPNPLQETPQHSPTLTDKLTTLYDDPGILPSQPHYPGQAGFLLTNERMKPEVRRQLIATKPDGFVIGTGAGTIFGLPGVFPEDTPCKGIISIDHKPEVVLGGLMLAELAKQGLSADDILDLFHHELGKYPYSFARDIIAQQHPSLRPRLSHALEAGNTFSLGTITTQAREYFEEIKNDEADPKFVDGDRLINIPDILRRNWEVITGLANSGNLVFIYSDLLSPHTASAIAKLAPDLLGFRNIFYGSNVLNHARHYYDGPIAPQPNFDTLRALDPDSKGIYLSCDNKDYQLHLTPHQ